LGLLRPLGLGDCTEMQGAVPSAQGTSSRL
jgi:hypothetical protein